MNKYLLAFHRVILEHQNIIHIYKILPLQNMEQIDGALNGNGACNSHFFQVNSLREEIFFESTV